MCQGGKGKGERVFEVQNYIGAKPFRKKRILHSDHLSMGLGSAVWGKLKREKNIGEPSELSGSLGTREKVPRDLFMPFHTIFPIFFPTAEPGKDTISLETILVQPEVNKLDSVY